MSASHDKTQKATFVFTNLYQLYRKEKDAAASADASTSSAQAESLERAPFVARPNSSQHVLKADDLRNSAESLPRVEAYNPPSFINNAAARSKASAKPAAESVIGTRVARPEYLAPGRSEAIESLKENLKNLNDLHARLRFMLQELEELVK